ncbi:unnamed protein product [Camellia sinensis]
MKKKKKKKKKFNTIVILYYWYGSVCLKDAIPRLFSLSREKEGALSLFVKLKEVSGEWNIFPRREFFVWERDEMLRFVSVLQSGPAVSLGRMDYPRWSANSSGVFSVSSLYNSATVGLCSGSRPSKLLWNNGLPPKVQFFGWLAWKHRIKVSVFIRRIGVFAGRASSLCCFGKTEEESVLHVLLHCSFVWEVWSSILAWWGLKWVIPGSVANLLSWWEGGTFLKHEKKIWRSVPLVALWSIWKLRNECTFNGAIADVGDLSELIKARVAIWLVSSSKGWNYSNRSSALLQHLVPIAVSLQRCWGDAQRYGVAAGVLAANRGCCCCMDLLMVLGRMMLVF